MSAICVCLFCGAIVDSVAALRAARSAARVYCDEACHIADDANLLDRLWRALVS